MKRHLLLAVLLSAFLVSGCLNTPAESVTAAPPASSEAPAVQSASSKTEAVSSLHEDDVTQPQAVAPSESVASKQPSSTQLESTPAASDTAPAEAQVTMGQQVFETLYPTFSPSVKTIPFNIINDTGKEYGTGDRFRLQILEGNVWVDLPQLPLPENAVILNPAISGPFWPPYTRTRYTAPIDKIDGTDYPLYGLPLKTGTYRLTDGYKIRNVSKPFEITDTPSEWQQSTIERLNQAPALAGISFSPHDFAVPFVCQGVISDSDISGVKLYVFLFPDKKEAKAVFDGIEQDGYAIPK
ncbi:MAG TPA: hypothetical protein VN626_09870, partial [Clostridia bacterium]|nr:hypothetical protein [Clostridia bacterium]